MSKSPSYVRVAERIKTELLSASVSQSGAKLPTQEELAERFEVSRSTIVRSLSKLVAEGLISIQQGSGIFAVSQEKREAASRSISLIVPNLHAPVIAAACRGVERRARELGYRTLLASSEFGLKHEHELVEQYTDAGVAGIILYPVTRRRSDITEDYLMTWKRQIPIVTLDIACEEWPCSRVQFDNYRLGFDMTQQILKHGRRRILFMKASPDFLHSSIHDRQRGWEAALEEGGVGRDEIIEESPFPLSVFLPKHNSEEYEAIAQGILKMNPRPDAVIAWNDISAAYLIQALINCGVRVPEDILVTGFDSEPTISKLFRPQFPTTKPDFVRLGEMAVEVLDRNREESPIRPRIYYYPVPVQWRDPRHEVGMAVSPDFRKANLTPISALQD